MSKFYGEIGFGEQQIESSPGIWETKYVVKKFYGDILTNTFRSQNNVNTINNDIVITNKISIIADPYLLNHFHEITYVKWRDTKRKVTSVEEQYPRLILTLGGSFNNEEQ